MQVYTYSEARQNLALLLEKAKTEGAILIKRKDGTIFELRTRVMKKSPLNVKGVELDLNKNEIIEIIKEVRER